MGKTRKKNVWLSVMLCVLMLLGTIGITGSVSGEEKELDIDDYLFLETGTREKPEDDNWDQGDFVAINMTKNGALSWFGVIYGTEEDPNGILIFCAYIRFLGAAEVYEANGNFVGRYPIPIVTVFGQKLFVLFEYQDDGRFYNTPLPGTWEDRPEYADNGVFDFVKNNENPGLWAISDQHETVTKAVNLQRAWQRSTVVETSDVEDTTTKSWDFSIWAEDVDYGIENENGDVILDDPDNTLDKLEFTFHVTANVDEVDITGVPWYEVTVDSGNHKNVIDSEYKTSKDYTGVSVTADFKFDHLIEGWDFSGGDGIVLINHGFFANLIPEKVEEWLGEQFVKNIAGYGNAEYEALDPNLEDVTSSVISSDGTEDTDENGDGIVDAKVVQKDVIKFKDNWQEIGEFTWVSNAVVDGEDKNVIYQVHGGQQFNDTDKDGNQLKGFIIQGGYVYPAGNDIYHDPALVAIALLFEVVDYALNLLPGYLVGGQLLIALIAAVIIVVMVKTRKRRGKADPPPPQYTVQGPNPNMYQQPPISPPMQPPGS
ncbi:MAG: hypothetical protein V3U20_10735 [Thermoplasmata archaeon]